MPKIVIFASGTKTGGGSGFENLVIQTRTNSRLNYEAVGVVSNNRKGGVRERADRLGVPFIFFPGPFTEREYKRIVEFSEASYVALSGWVKLVLGLNPAHTFNIHPGPLPLFGGKNMYGMRVHQAILEAFRRGEISQTEVTMHFVTDVYDEGPVFFRYPVSINDDDTAEILAGRVSMVEHKWQPKITSLVVNEEISWDGENPLRIKVPKGYRYL